MYIPVYGYYLEPENVNKNKYVGRQLGIQAGDGQRARQETHNIEMNARTLLIPPWSE